MSRRSLLVIFPICIGLLLGCESNSAHPQTSSTNTLQLPRPTVEAPHFKVFRQPKEDSDIVPLVVSTSTTNEQIISLLWLVRDQVRVRDMASLGIKAKPAFLSSGMVEIFKGSRCASEDDFDAPLPCGSGNHSAAFYQWGVKGNPEMDFAGVTAKDGTFTKLFGSANTSLPAHK